MLVLTFKNRTVEFSNGIRFLKQFNDIKGDIYGRFILYQA